MNLKLLCVFNERNVSLVIGNERNISQCLTTLYGKSNKLLVLTFFSKFKILKQDSTNITRYIWFKIALAAHLYDQEAPDTIYSDYLIMEDKRSQLMLMYQIKGVQGIEIVRFMTFCTRRKACISLTQSSRTLTNSTKKFLRLKGTLADAYVRRL